MKKLTIVKSGLTRAAIEAFADPNTKFFTRDTMRFFASRIHSGYRVGWSGEDFVVFITSEKTGFESTTRAYTVRVITQEHAVIRTVGDHGAYPTLQDARHGAKVMISAGTILDSAI